jgi:hypothetical protein
VKYIRENQTELHVEKYSGLMDYVNNREGEKIFWNRELIK